MSEPQPRSWWGRNWKWVVPVGCLLPVVVCGGGIALFITLLFGMLKSSEPYRDGVAKAQASPAVKAALGEPVTAGFMVTGSVSVQNTNGVQSGLANLSIPLSGPKGSATLRVVGTQMDGQWTYTVMDVSIPGQNGPIDLLVEK